MSDVADMFEGVIGGIGRDDDGGTDVSTSLSTSFAISSGEDHSHLAAMLE